MNRVIAVFSLVFALGWMDTLPLDSGPVKGASSWLLSAKAPVRSGAFRGQGFDIGRPLSDRDIDLRGAGIGTFPVQVKPGVIYGEDGPVKLWDEVSVGEGPDGVPGMGTHFGK